MLPGNPKYAAETVRVQGVEKPLEGFTQKKSAPCTATVLLNVMDRDDEGDWDRRKFPPVVLAWTTRELGAPTVTVVTSTVALIPEDAPVESANGISKA